MLKWHKTGSGHLQAWRPDHCGVYIVSKSGRRWQLCIESGGMIPVNLYCDTQRQAKWEAEQHSNNHTMKGE